MRKQINILNCPLCGTKSNTFHFNHLWGVQCLNIDCGAKVDGFSERELAVKTWNKRSIKIKEFNVSRRIHKEKGCDAFE